VQGSYACTINVKFSTYIHAVDLLCNKINIGHYTTNVTGKVSMSICCVHVWYVFHLVRVTYTVREETYSCNIHKCYVLLANDPSKGLLWLVHRCSTLSCRVVRSLGPLRGAYGLLVILSLALHTHLVNLEVCPSTSCSATSS